MFPTNSEPAAPSDQSFLDKVANFAKGAWNSVNPRVSNPSSSPFYQIKGSDITGGMSGVAKSQGGTYDDWMKANPGMNTLTKGTYLTAPKSSQGPTGTNVNINPASQNNNQSVGQMGTNQAITGQMNAANFLAGIGVNNPGSQMHGDTTGYVTNQGTINELKSLDSLPAGVMPSHISNAAAEARGITPDNLLAHNYTYDQASSTWVAPSGAGTTGGGNKPPGWNAGSGGGGGNAWSYSVNPRTGVVKKKLAYNPNRGSQTAPVLPTASNAGQTASDVLASKLGSG